MIEKKFSLIKIFSFLDTSLRKKVILYFILSFFASLIEVIGAASIFPFLSLMTQQGRYANFLFENFPLLEDFLRSERQLIYFFSCLFLLLFVLTSIVRVFVIKKQYHISNAAEHFLVQRILKIISTIDYQVFLSIDKSSWSSTILNEARIYSDMALLPAIVLLSQSLTIIFFLVSLAFFDWRLVFLVAVFFVGLFAIGAFFLSVRMRSLGNQRAQLVNERFALVHDALNNVREFKINRNKDDFHIRVSTISASLADVQAESSFYTFLPKVAFEAVGVVILIGSLWIVSAFSNVEPANLLPIIGLYAMAGYRMLPSLNQLSASYNVLCSSRAVINNIEKIFSLPVTPISNFENSKIKFDNIIKAEKLSFRYQADQEPVFENLSFEIAKGDFFVIYGSSGSGKSTLLNILLGFIPTIDGSVSVDNIPLEPKNLGAWWKLVSFVPQDVSLYNDTIANNISQKFQDPCINDNKLLDVLRKSGFDLSEGAAKAFLAKNIRDNASKLSGGQRQRLAVARALFANRSILILDEATSAVDPVAQRIICTALKEMTRDGKTVIFCSHDPAVREYATKTLVVG